jgi:hypothetical protein
MRKKLILALILGFTLTTVSCTSSRTMVLNVPKEPIKALSINVMEEQGTVNVPPEVRSMFRDKLEKLLFIGEQDKSPPFTKGSDLHIHYRFIQFTAGSRFKRVGWPVV